jgi:CIC family chloride channel protein
MFLGAAMGGGLASLFLAETDADRMPVIGACALVGMASVVAATTHAPLMASVLAFEMSGDYALVIPLLASTALATATARALRRDSIYTAELRRRGIVWDGSIAHRLARAIRARDVLEPALVLPATMPIDDARAQIVDRKARVAYATVEGGLASLDLRSIVVAGDPSPRSVAELARPVHPVRLDADVPTLAERLWTAEWGELPIPPARSRGSSPGAACSARSIASCCSAICCSPG